MPQREEERLKGFFGSDSALNSISYQSPYQSTTKTVFWTKSLQEVDGMKYYSNELFASRVMLSISNIPRCELRQLITPEFVNVRQAAFKANIIIYQPIF